MQCSPSPWNDDNGCTALRNKKEKKQLQQPKIYALYNSMGLAMTVLECNLQLLNTPLPKQLAIFRAGGEKKNGAGMIIVRSC
jgi:hypothetical protein